MVHVSDLVSIVNHFLVFYVWFRRCEEDARRNCTPASGASTKDGGERSVRNTRRRGCAWEETGEREEKRGRGGDGKTSTWLTNTTRKRCVAWNETGIDHVPCANEACQGEPDECQAWNETMDT